EFTKTWNDLAEKEGLKGFHFVGGLIEYNQIDKYGIHATAPLRHRIIEHELKRQPLSYRLQMRIYQLLRKNLKVYPYKEAMKFFLKPGECPVNEYPSIVPNWDTTARLGKRAVILHGSSPEQFRKHVQQVLDQVKHKPYEDNIVFIK